MHALAFKWDPFYIIIRLNVRDAVSNAFMKLVKGDLNEQCNQDLELLSKMDKNYSKVMTDFMSLTITTKPLLDTLKNYRPQFFWRQMMGKYNLLSEVLSFTSLKSWMKNNNY